VAQASAAADLCGLAVVFAFEFLLILRRSPLLFTLTKEGQQGESRFTGTKTRRSNSAFRVACVPTNFVGKARAFPRRHFSRRPLIFSEHFPHNRRILL